MSSFSGISTKTSGIDPVAECDMDCADCVDTALWQIPHPALPLLGKGEGTCSPFCLKSPESNKAN